MSFGKYGGSLVTSTQFFSKENQYFAPDLPNWGEKTILFNGVTDVSADSMGSNFNFISQTVLTCGGQQVCWFWNLKSLSNKTGFKQALRQ